MQLQAGSLYTVVPRILVLDSTQLRRQLIQVAMNRLQICIELDQMFLGLQIILLIRVQMVELLSLGV